MRPASWKDSPCGCGVALPGGDERVEGLRGADQGVALPGDGGPAPPLGTAETEGKSPREPGADGGMESGEGGHGRAARLARISRQVAPATAHLRALEREIGGDAPRQNLVAAADILKSDKK